MFTPKFIKFIPSQEAEFLQENYPNAFLLLCLIAKRARRIANHPDGLEIGEAHIGDYKKAGIETIRKYRTAKEILIKRGHIKICETCRTRKKSTTGTTTNGTKVKLLKSDIWDINFEDSDNLSDHRPTTDRPRTRKNKIEQEEETTTTKPSSSLPVDDPVPDLSVCCCSLEDLKEVDLTDDEKATLLKYPKDRVIKALEFSRLEPPTTTLIRLLHWHIRQPIPPISSKAEKVIPVSQVDKEVIRRQEEMQKLREDNLKRACELYDQCKSLIFTGLECQNKFSLFGNDFIVSNTYHSEKIYIYTLPSVFEELVISAMRKCGFWIPRQEKIIPIESQYANGH